MMYQTLKEANYTLVARKDNEAIFLNNDTKEKELFFANKNHGSWGIVLGSTHYEFARTADEADLIRILSK